MRGYNVERHYDRIAPAYGRFEEYNPRKQVLIGRQFKDVIGYLNGLSVLDMGCGAGFFSLLAKEMGAGYVLGVDVSQKQIDIARENAAMLHADIEFIKADVTALQLDKRFDVVTAGFVFNYTPSREILGKQISVAYDHLKVGGRLFSVLCNPDNPLRSGNVLYSVVPAGKASLGDGSKLRCEFYDRDGRLLCYDSKFLWSKRTVENVLGDTGFKNAEWIDIKNADSESGVPVLPSTNIILCAEK